MQGDSDTPEAGVRRCHHCQCRRRPAPEVMRCPPPTPAHRQGSPASRKGDCPVSAVTPQSPWAVRSCTIPPRLARYPPAVDGVGGGPTIPPETATLYIETYRSVYLNVTQYMHRSVDLADTYISAYQYRMHLSWAPRPSPKDAIPPPTPTHHRRPPNVPWRRQSKIG